MAETVPKLKRAPARSESVRSLIERLGVSASLNDYDDKVRMK